MLLGHRIRLNPTAKQEAYFRKASGVARFAYNWALNEWREAYARGERPTEVALRRKLNAVKRSEFPWMLDVSKNAPQQAIKNLGAAYTMYVTQIGMRRGAREPRFKGKGERERFRADNGPRITGAHAVRVRTRKVWIPRAGWVSMSEELRFAGQIKSLIISHRAGKWFASFAVDVPYLIPQRDDVGVIGVDLGISAFAVLSDGSKVVNPAPLKQHVRRLRRLARALDKKQRGSSNYEKAKLKLERLHEHIANIRHDSIHKLTTKLASEYRYVVIEDLHVAGMLRNRRVARALSDCGFAEFRRQLQYKCHMAGSTLKVADRWYPSSKTCSTCGRINRDLRWGARHWTCFCGAEHDRDVNAALNLSRAVSSTV